MINRSAIILRYKQPAIDWINKANPEVDSPGVTLQRVNEDRNVYLISDDDGDSPETVALWIKGNYRSLFEDEISAWYIDPSLQPKLTGLSMFNKWFDVEHYSMIVDTLGEPIEDDGF